ncbi:hypothetical protein ACIHBQ_31100 [Streptomyces sp. NPDC052492]|uniref:hypothetical protein n=1 Tax=unclassified Streptomyces TaxID=2593676 RepID=UPI0037D6809B
MTDPAGRPESRRAANARKRVSRRPSRLGLPAGATTGPDRTAEPGAGFPALLERTWRRAGQAPTLRAALEVLLTLDGHVPGDIQLRALSSAEQAALTALCGLDWRDPHPTHDPHPTPGAPGTPQDAADAGPPAFAGEIGLATNGRIAVRTPGRPPLDPRDLVGGVRRVPWTRTVLDTYRHTRAKARARLADSAADCRAWLAAQGPQGRDALVAQARQAALRTAPFVLHQEDTTYTNFRGRNTLTGKTLWPGHPDCALSALTGLPLEVWSDQDTQLVVCLTLLIRSAGFGRVEEANGTQLTVDHVAHTLERLRRAYNAVPGVTPVPAAASHRVADLDRLAAGLRTGRAQAGARAQLYREIHGPLMHKVERVAAAPGAAAHARRAAVAEQLAARLGLAGTTLDELGQDLAARPAWLTAPHGAFATGLESLVHETTAAAADAFHADFAMSRGTRSLPRLIRALRAQNWAEICDWDITHFFCCVVPRREAAAHFGGSGAALADAAWAMSSRMQYNSWHFVAGNLPPVPEVEARDHFVPPALPDVAFHSDQHHHGHVNNHVRFSIRSPQAVEVAGRRFDGFTDLRLLRCAGDPFDEQDLLAAHQVSAFVAHATQLAARLAADGTGPEVTAFDSDWHWRAVTGRHPASSGPPAGQVRRAS